MESTTRRREAFAALAAAGCLWGTGFLFGKWALTELSVGQMVLYRFVFAVIGFAPAIWRGLSRPQTRIARRDWSFVFIAALVGVPIQFLVQFAGLARTTVTHASLMVGNLPVLLAAGSALFAHEHVTGRRWLALIISTLGAAMIAFGASSGEAGSQASLAGDLLVAASLIAAVGWVLMSQRLMKSGNYSPVNTSAYVMTLGALLLAIWVIGTEGWPPIHLSARTWISVAASGLLATTTTTYLWNWGLVRVPASQAGVFINLEPVVGAILGVAILRDVLGPYGLLGGILVVGAAIAVALEPPMKRAERGERP
ncbi:MAG TPA: DMT family transporter [Gemmatimonadaceae bacterium]|nr:DMT family transporter [Gemmatimonadaceae bacterium]